MCNRNLGSRCRSLLLGRRFVGRWSSVPSSFVVRRSSFVVRRSSFVVRRCENEEFQAGVLTNTAPTSDVGCDALGNSVRKGQVKHRGGL